jgi:hypothetical protein
VLVYVDRLAHDILVSDLTVALSRARYERRLERIRSHCLRSTILGTTNPANRRVSSTVPEHPKDSEMVTNSASLIKGVTDLRNSSISSSAQMSPSYVISDWLKKVDTNRR